MKLSARSIYPGLVEGEALVSPMGISFFGGVDPESGVVVERGHALEGRSVAGMVLVFPRGKGSTVGSYTLYRLKAAGRAPLAIVNAECETITAVGCIIAEIPCVDQVDLSRLENGQRLRIDAAAGVVEILAADGNPPPREATRPAPASQSRAHQPPTPPFERLPEPLRGVEPGSFAERTLSQRLPGIARRALEATDWPQASRLRLQALIADMPHGRLRPLEDPGAPDEAFWRQSMAPYEGLSWLSAPWLPAEVYFFRCLLAASGYYQPGPSRGVDPYRAEKQEGLQAAEGPLAEAYAALAKQAQRSMTTQALAQLLRQVVWGNQADLSLFPAGEEGPQTSGEEHLLIDHAAAAAEHLAGLQGRGSRVDVLCDNSGLELAFDLLLIDFLFERDLAGEVVLHVKPFPTYVSDVTPVDLDESLAFFSRSKNASVHGLAKRMQQRIDAGSLVVADHLHWAGPLPNWELPPDLQRALSGSALILIKGDLNYRRWLGDLTWPYTTPFETITAYRPAPLLALRVLKSNMLAGLPPGMQAEMDRSDPDWLYNGRWGVIQFAA